MQYDSFRRLTLLTNPDNSTMAFSYNTADQMTTQVDELGKSITNAYDLLGRQTSLTNRVNAVTNWTYDSISRLKTQTDAIGNVVTVFYNNRGWLDKIVYPDPDLAIATLKSAEDVRSYDLVGNLKSQGTEVGKPPV